MFLGLWAFAPGGMKKKMRFFLKIFFSHHKDFNNDFTRKM